MLTSDLHSDPSFWLHPMPTGCARLDEALERLRESAEDGRRRARRDAWASVTKHILRWGGYDDATAHQVLAQLYHAFQQLIPRQRFRPIPQGLWHAQVASPRPAPCTPAGPKGNPTPIWQLERRIHALARLLARLSACYYAALPQRVLRRLRALRCGASSFFGTDKVDGRNNP